MLRLSAASRQMSRLLQTRAASSSSSSSSSDPPPSSFAGPYDLRTRTAAVPRPPSAAELFTTEKFPAPAPQPEPYDPKALFSHPLYTPPARYNSEIGPLIPPLHFPEFDQKTKSQQETGHVGESAWHYSGFDVGGETVGAYPRLPMEWTQLRDPYKYWDQQGRRTYGEIVQENHHLTDEWGIGPEQHWWNPLRNLLSMLALMGGIGAAVAYWDPSEHLWTAPKDYPFDGLRVELGGDPADSSDDYTRARVYEDNFKSGYKNKF